VYHLASGYGPHEAFRQKINTCVLNTAIYSKFVQKCTPEQKVLELFVISVGVGTLHISAIGSLVRSGLSRGALLVVGRS
jgi:hypothetical protein